MEHHTARGSCSSVARHPTGSADHDASTRFLTTKCTVHMQHTMFEHNIHGNVVLTHIATGSLFKNGNEFIPPYTTQNSSHKRSIGKKISNILQPLRITSCRNLSFGTAAYLSLWLHQEQLVHLLQNFPHLLDDFNHQTPAGKGRTHGIHGSPQFSNML